ncbi:hypothetical protein EON65_49780 [archaeon]|nr:MAG: hypothetical protein EON65_49780 [archaeon]
MVKRKRANSASDSVQSADASESSSDDEQQSSRKRFAYTNKQRVLIIASRGITARHRYFLEDLKKLIPHHKKENKLDDKGDIQAVNEIAEMKTCNQVIYLEARKHQDLYMYIGKLWMWVMNVFGGISGQIIPHCIYVTNFAS